MISPDYQEDFQDEELPQQELPQYARRNREGHYTWDGVPYPSVTTILHQMGGEGLLNWYGKMAAEDCLKQLEAMEAGILSQKQFYDAIRDTPRRMNAAVRYRDHKGNIGTLVHHGIYTRVVTGIEPDWTGWLEAEALKLGIANPEGNDGYPYARTLAKETALYLSGALDWLEKERPEFESIGQEAVVVSETNCYAGTMDGIFKLAGHRYAVDFKSSNSIQEQRFRMQIEAYRRADFIGLTQTGEKFPMLSSDKVAILHIKPIDQAKLVVFEPSDDLYEAFLCQAYCYALLKGMPKKRKPKSFEPKKPTAKFAECPFGQELR